MSISEVFYQAVHHHHKVFIPFVTAGDPTLLGTAEFLCVLERAGAGIIELGVPFSDPMADGPTIQRSSQRGLEQGATVLSILRLVADLRHSGKLTVPVVLFTYLNPVLALGFEEFTERARRARVDGLLILDLPPEEAGPYCRAALQNGLEMIFLASPTTTTERLRTIDELSTGFVYYVSRLGVTGVQQELSCSLGEEIARLRRVVTKPLAVGFGISSAEQAVQVARLADGVVIGSKMVSLIEESNSVPEACDALEEFTRSVAGALRCL
ncbi:MAG: tryptophan synthase subunit alpha [Acidobacteriales bacterium]|nr:tryptophan synthase subunit alpha [Terriglobales bacterium]